MKNIFLLGTLVIISTKSMQEEKTEGPVSHDTVQHRIALDNNIMVTPGSNGRIHIFDASTGRHITTLPLRTANNTKTNSKNNADSESSNKRD